MLDVFRAETSIRRFSSSHEICTNTPSKIRIRTGLSEGVGKQLCDGEGSGREWCNKCGVSCDKTVASFFAAFFDISLLRFRVLVSVSVIVRCTKVRLLAQQVAT